MEIYFKSKATGSQMCILKDGSFCREMTVANYVDGTADIMETKRRFPIDHWKRMIVETNNYEKSNKAEFMEAYKNAKNTIKTFADKLIMK